MGLCTSQAERYLSAGGGDATTDDGDAAGAGDYANRDVIKLLLLGTAECGKSTILKQMQIVHLNGFTEPELRARRHVVHNNVVQAVLTLARAMYAAGGTYEGGAGRLADERLLLRRVAADPAVRAFDATMATAVANLWSDAAVQAAYERRNEFQLIDTARYLFDSLGRIAAADYVPSVQDVLNTRVPTTGIVEMRFAVDGRRFLVIDVGGQRTERRKWVHCFEAVNAVIYIVAVSEFDQCLAEDGCTNRLREAMLLFRTLLNSPWFARNSFILFLNKTDVFLEKIKAGRSVAACFDDYTGEPDYRSSLAFVRHKLRVLNESPHVRRVYAHDTCATDTGQMAVVLKRSLDTVISRNLCRAGVM